MQTTGSSVFLADSCSTQVLRSRETNIQQSLAALEKERGVSGFRDTTENLERVAEQKVTPKLISFSIVLGRGGKVENFFFYWAKLDKA